MAEKIVSKQDLKKYSEKLKINANILKRNFAYTIDQTVNKGQVVLKCITAGTTDRYPLDFTGISVGDTLTDGTAEWQVISTTGYGSGSGGTSISEWATATSYETGQIVIYGDSLYRCITDHTSNIFNGDIANWELMYSDIAEWRDSVYYTEGVTVIHDHKLYQCLTAHLSLTTFDGAKWQIIGDYVAVPVKVGSVGCVSWQYTLMQNHLALDGSVVSNFQATYPELYDFFDTNSLITTVQADYDDNHALLLYDSVNDEATMPNFLDKTVWGGTIIEEKEAGLPNITGQSYLVVGSYGIKNDGSSGALTSIATTTAYANASGSVNQNCNVHIKLDASRSNPIYGNSTTVQPPAIQLIPQIRYTQDYIEGAGGGTSISEWETTTDYEEGEIVIYANSLYRCIADHTSTTFSSDVANWQLIYSDIKEWEDDVYYTVGVTVINDNKLYKCITAHLSQSTFDGSKWQIIGDYITAPAKVGEVGCVSWQYKLLDNHLKLGGQTINNFGVTYPELLSFFTTNSLVTSVQSDYDANKALLLYDSTSDIATMPDFLDKTVWGSSTIEEKEAGLPNITGKDPLGWAGQYVGLVTNAGNASGALAATKLALNGAVNYSTSSGSTTVVRGVAFDASKSNIIYGNSTTVQPPAIGLIPQIRYRKDTIDVTVNIYNDTPIGTIIPYMGTTPPAEYLSCDGTVYNISQYQALADFINDEFGSYNYFGGDGTTTFAVPDLRGEFLRGTGTNSHTNQGSGDSVGVHQDGTKHNNLQSVGKLSNTSVVDKWIGIPGRGPDILSPIGVDVFSENVDRIIHAQASNDYVSGVMPSYYTSRPTNTSVLYCIKYTNSKGPEKIKEWVTSYTYEVGDYVLKDNQIYRCNTAHTSSTFSSEIADWDLISGLQVWQANTTYKEDSLLYHEGKLYKVNTSFTSTSTFSDTNLDMVSGGGLVDWQASTAYKVDDIFVYDGQIYKVLVGFTSGATFAEIDILEDYILAGETPIPWAEGTEINTNDIVEYNSEYYKALYDFTCGDTFTKVAFEQYVPKSLTEAQIEEIIRDFNPAFDGALGFVVQDSAPAHNAVFRSNDLTDYFNSGQMSEAIADGSFRNIFPGDYIIKSVTVNGTTYNDVVWIVGDLDYFYTNGDTETTTHHVLLFPKDCIGTSYMNSSNTSANGYVGSYMWSTRIPQYVTGITNAFGSAHVLQHRELLTTSMDTNGRSSAYCTWGGASNNWAWANVKVNIFNENMIYGGAQCSSSMYDTGDGNTQISVMRHHKSYIHTRSNWYWLRSVTSGTGFANCSSIGSAGLTGASDVGGLRPYFLLL